MTLAGSLSTELLEELRKSFSGELKLDLATRLLYSTDASIYQIEPLGVAFPRTPDDIAAAVEICSRNKVPVLARGAGSSLAGQAIGAALVLDCSRHLTKIIRIDPEQQIAEVEPGVILSDLNRSVGKFGLRFGPDPASSDRATIGGSLANNATGAHSILYGMSADHLLGADIILGDGSQARLAAMKLERALEKAGGVGGEGAAKHLSIEARLYRAVLEIRDNYSEEIKRRWPKTWRCVSGYNLPYLLPWSPSKPPQWILDDTYPPVSPGIINLAPLIAGSEGTLGVIQRAHVRLVPSPKCSILVVLPYLSLEEACESVPELLEHGPSAVELIPQSLVSLAKSIPSYARQLSFVDQLKINGKVPEALLAVEFYGDDHRQLEQKAEQLGKNGLVAGTAEMQKKVWEVRNVGLGILNSKPGDEKAISLIEDLSVPVERLPEFVRNLRQILGAYGKSIQLYAHASAGCLHGRFLLNTKTEEGLRAMRSIAAEAVDMTLALGGAASGEHGDGLSRSEWLEKAFGPDLIQAFKLIKKAADPENILNPGKIVDPQPMDANLRFDPVYKTSGWTPIMNFSISGGFPGEVGLLGAVELCNGAGVCRKSGGVMCPSFQVLQDEKHNTRGRANLLRAMMSGKFPSSDEGERAVKEALDLCLACKGCKAECPSGMDLAKIKIEFINNYYRSRRRPVRDYLFGYIDLILTIGAPFALLANSLLSSEIFRKVGAQGFGITPERTLPFFASPKLSGHLNNLPQPAPEAEPVLILLDAFNRYFYPEVCYAALRALIEAGCRPILLPNNGAGRTLLSKGLLGAARRQAEGVLASINKLDPVGVLPVVGIEPSEIYTLKDEYPDLLTSFDGREEVERFKRRIFLIDEYLVRPGKAEKKRILRIVDNQIQPPAINEQRRVLLHSHCYQKAQPPASDGFAVGTAATVEMLEAAGFQVEVVEAGCCGMAGSFGYEAEHYDLSMKIGEDRLFPSIRAAGEDVIVAAVGVSCQSQINDGTGYKPVHPLNLLFQCEKQYL
jgi:FAD/FMN-containing dehydrogenase/Fe-S oxidoreductase